MIGENMIIDNNAPYIIIRFDLEPNGDMVERILTTDNIFFDRDCVDRNDCMIFNTMTEANAYCEENEDGWNPDLAVGSYVRSFNDFY